MIFGLSILIFRLEQYKKWNTGFISNACSWKWSFIYTSTKKEKSFKQDTPPPLIEKPLTFITRPCTSGIRGPQRYLIRKNPHLPPGNTSPESTALRGKYQLWRNKSGEGGKARRIEKTRGVRPALAECRADVRDAGPQLVQRRAEVSTYCGLHDQCQWHWRSQISEDWRNKRTDRGTPPPGKHQTSAQRWLTAGPAS